MKTVSDRVLMPTGGTFVKTVSDSVLNAMAFTGGKPTGGAFVKAVSHSVLMQWRLLVEDRREELLGAKVFFCVDCRSLCFHRELF